MFTFSKMLSRISEEQCYCSFHLQVVNLVIQIYFFSKILILRFWIYIGTGFLSPKYCYIDLTNYLFQTSTISKIFATKVSFARWYTYSNAPSSRSTIVCTLQSIRCGLFRPIMQRLLGASSSIWHNPITPFCCFKTMGSSSTTCCSSAC